MIMTVAREYLRVSVDKTGEMESPAQQHHDNAGAAADHGWTLGEPYAEDEGVSASRFSTKVRDEFGKLLTDLESGEFAADILIIWESSRGSRRVGEWATLVDRLEDAGVQVYVTSHDRIYNPANAHDRKTLLSDAVDSDFESGKTSARVKRAARAHAAEGKPAGRVAFGYRREYKLNDAGKREFAGQYPHPDEAPVVIEIFDRIRAGESLKGIVRDFAERGVTQRSGKPFGPQDVRDIALRPCYIGLRAHVAGNRSGRYQGSLEGVTAPAQWPALVDDEAFYAVRQTLTNPARTTTRPGGAKHLLSLIAACAQCGGPLSVTYRYGSEREYVCRNKSCVRMDAGALDVFVQDVVSRYLSKPEILAMLKAEAAGHTGTELAAVRVKLAAERAELTALQAGAAAGKVTVATVLAVEPGITDRVGKLEHQERELSTPPELAGLLGSADVATWWVDAPLAAQRAVVRLVCTAGLLGRITVAKAPKPGHRGNPADRVVWQH